MEHGRAAISWFEAGHAAGVDAERARCADKVRRLPIPLNPGPERTGWEWARDQIISAIEAEGEPT